MFKEFITNFHFAEPAYLLLLVAIAASCILSKYYKLTEKKQFQKYYKLFSKENLNYLVKSEHITNNKNIYLLIICLSLLSLALAKPRWQYETVSGFQENNNMVFLLDSSNSMSATDIAPSRFVKAKQEIADIVKYFTTTRFGLIAFNNIAYNLLPLSFDQEAMLDNLKNLQQKDFNQAGSNLNIALESALNYFARIPGANKFIIVFTDGDFTEALDKNLNKQLSEANIRLFIYALGTEVGAPLFQTNGKALNYEGQQVIAKLDLKNLEILASQTKAALVTANYSNQDLEKLIAYVEATKQEQQESNTELKIWSEALTIFLLPALFLFLLMMRKEIIAIFIISYLAATDAQAFNFTDLFLNQDQQAKRAYKTKDYAAAQQKFTDKYNQAVSAYRAGDYTAAKKLFSEAEHEKALYNLGNSNFKLADYQQAIENYTAYLSNNPDDQAAQHNLAVAKEKLQEQQQQNNSQQQEQNSETENSKQQPETQQKQNQQDNNEQQNPTENQQNSEQQPEELSDKIFDLIETDSRNLMQEKLKNMESNQTKEQNSVKPW